MRPVSGLNGCHYAAARGILKERGSRLSRCVFSGCQTTGCQTDGPDNTCELRHGHFGLRDDRQSEQVIPSGGIRDFGTRSWPAVTAEGTLSGQSIFVQAGGYTQSDDQNPIVWSIAFCPALADCRPARLLTHLQTARRNTHR
jgi:hypothetical protein